MKKFLCLIFCISMLCSCTSKTQNIKPITKGLSFDAQINYYNETYECNVVLSKNGDSEISFTSPKELKGLKIVYSGNNKSINYNGLKYDMNSNSPQYSASDIIYKTFSYDYVNVCSDDNNYYVENKELKCKMYIGATGLPIKIENPSEFNIIIKNATLNEKEP